MKLTPSASQTVGPFFNFALTSDRTLGVLASDGVAGERIRLAFRVVDGNGAPTPGDSMIELWQADAHGRYPDRIDSRAGEAGPNFSGFGRLETNADGVCVFETIKPGPVADGRGETQAPHINVALFARGLLKQLYTRVYFEGEPANQHDLVLSLVPEERRATLLARQSADQTNLWSIEIHLQGDRETVFFEL
jgi:protocatechuate 3,4-dioxygenase, alpha subunit